LEDLAVNPKEGGGMVRYPAITLHGPSTQKTTNLIFTAVKISNLEVKISTLGITRS
jgi:hypothetical protein